MQTLYLRETETALVLKACGASIKQAVLHAGCIACLYCCPKIYVTSLMSMSFTRQVNLFLSTLDSFCICWLHLTMLWSDVGSVTPVDSIANDRQVAQQLLMIPLQQEPPDAVAFGHFLFNAQFQLPVSARPFQLVKAHDPELADTLYQCGDCRIRAAVSDALQLSDSVLGNSHWVDL